MSGRDTLNSAISTSGKAQVVAVVAAVSAAQSTIDLANTFVGYNLQTGSYSVLAAAVKSATITKANALFAAEQAKQASIALARDALRSSGGDLASL